MLVAPSQQIFGTGLISTWCAKKKKNTKPTFTLLPAFGRRPCPETRTEALCRIHQNISSFRFLGSLDQLELIEGPLFSNSQARFVVWSVWLWMDKENGKFSKNKYEQARVVGLELMSGEQTRTLKTVLHMVDYTPIKLIGEGNIKYLIISAYLHLYSIQILYQAGHWNGLI